MFESSRAEDRPIDVLFATSNDKAEDVTRASLVCVFDAEDERWHCRSEGGQRITTIERRTVADLREYNPVGRDMDTARVINAEGDDLTGADDLRRAAVLRIAADLDPRRQMQETVNALAAGTPVVVSPSSPVVASSASPAVYVIPDEAIVTMGRLGFDQPFAFEAAVTAAHREGFWRRSTWAAADDYVSQIGFTTVAEPSVTALLVTRRPNMVVEAIQQVLSQSYVRTELVLGLHGNMFDMDELRRELAEATIPTSIHQFDAVMPFGEVLDSLVIRASGRLVAKFDDDDWYSTEHLSDLVAAWRLTGADVVGKAANFAYLEKSDRTLAYDDEFQFREVGHIPGGTMITSRDLLSDYRFGRAANAVDSVLLRKVRADGGVLFSTTRQGFMRRRHSGHTAQFDDDWYVRRAHGRVMFGLRLDLAGVKAEQNPT